MTGVPCEMPRVLSAHTKGAGEFSDIIRFKFFLKKIRSHLWKGHIIRHNEFAVNILEEAIPGKSPWEDLDCGT
jgi:hypothetical protein